MPRFRRILLTVIPLLLVPLVFLFDVARLVVDLDITGLATAREIALVGSFACVFALFEERARGLRSNIPKEIGRLLIATVSLLLVVACISLLAGFGDAAAQAGARRVGTMRLLASFAVGSGFTVLAIQMLLRIRDMVLRKPTPGVRRKFFVYLVGLGLSILASMPFVPVGLGWINALLFLLLLFIAALNAFRQNWIVYLSRREKVYTIVYSGFLFIALTILDVLLARDSIAQRTVLAFSVPLHTGVQEIAMFATVQFGMAFVSTLFHLPTAEIFERKQSELRSLHNLGRLITQVFDFPDLVRTVTQMTIEVCGARCAWLELLERNETTGEMQSRVAARQHIGLEEIALLNGEPDSGLRKAWDGLHRAMLIDDLWTDRRTKQMKDHGIARGSLLSVPLISQGRLLGILHAMKAAEHSFDQDDIDVMTAFGDHATIAIDNARLIARSIERERLEQEMMVARRMQKRLLPQSLPQDLSVEFSAFSESSTEVGGDYYDLFRLEDGRYGLIIADVAGKGVSAAFYMAEMKGVFLTLSRLYRSPRDLLVQANRALLESLEKNAFISVVYAVIDLSLHELVLARAGHCPIVLARGDSVEMIRPNGIGLGLTDSERFAQVTEERVVRLEVGDSCVFYTDGVTEARNRSGEEFGYERLLETVRRHQSTTAEGLRDGIVDAVRTFLGNSTYTDDMTLVVIKRRPDKEEHARGQV